MPVVDVDDPDAPIEGPPERPSRSVDTGSVLVLVQGTAAALGATYAATRSLAVTAMAGAGALAVAAMTVRKL